MSVVDVTAAFMPLKCDWLLGVIWAHLCPPRRPWPAENFRDGRRGGHR